MTDGTPEKVDIITKHTAQMENELRGYFKGLNDRLVAQGLSESAADNIILNAIARYMVQMITYISMVLKATELDKDPTSEEMSETMEKVSNDVFEAVQTILSKYSGKSILHVSKNQEGESL